MLIAPENTEGNTQCRLWKRKSKRTQFLTQRVKRVSMGTLGQTEWYRSTCAFVKAKVSQKREKIQNRVVRRERWKREGNEQRTPKHCLWKCIVFQRTARPCRGSESLVYLLKSPPELSIELLQLTLVKFQPCNCVLQTFQPLQQKSLLREPRQLLPFRKSLLGIQRGDDVSWCHVKVKKDRINTSGRVTGLGLGAKSLVLSWSTGQNNTLFFLVALPHITLEKSTQICLHAFWTAAQGHPECATKPST